MLVVLSPKVGSSFKNVPERSITGISGRFSFSSRLLTWFPDRLLSFTLYLLAADSFTIFGTIFAELDFVAFIKEPGNFRSVVFSLLMLVVLLLVLLAACGHRLCVSHLVSPLLHLLPWFIYTGIFVFNLLLPCSGTGHFEDFIAAKAKIYLAVELH